MSCMFSLQVLYILDVEVLDFKYFIIVFLDDFQPGISNMQELLFFRIYNRMFKAFIVLFHLDLQFYAFCALINIPLA